LLDGAAVASVISEVRERHACVDVLLHAGGIEISRPLSDKEPAEFERVFDIKADGFFSLLKASEGLPVGASVVFSSVAGRFGNAGQCDYSAANGLLCAMSRSLLRARPGTRPIAIDWTAWGGIGMATRGSIPRIMEMAGIEMLAPEVGIPTIRRELVRGGTADEIIVGGRLGILVQEWDQSGGLDLDKANAALAQRGPKPPMVGRITGASLTDGVTVETLLDPNVQPFLYDHQIEGTPVLPGVMGSEAFAEVASVLCPGWSVARVEHAAFHAPFKFYRMQPATLHLHAVGRPLGDDVAVYVQLKSVVQPRPELPPQVRVHFAGQVRMTREAPAGTTIAFEPAAGATVSRDAIYRLFFHGPAYQVLSGVTLDDRLAVGLMSDRLPPDMEPANAASLVAPRLIELCFQTAGVIEAARKEALGLPTSYRSVGIYRRPEQAEGLRLHAVVSYSPGADEYDAQVVDDRGRVYVELSGYRTVALPGRKTIEVSQPERAGA
jgi:3-hydroxymyristoyl/3-hydroxydecanoyl-(acyl carrier protein) dehydratase